jgi:DNA/RNA endonuclease YhcR with UshA esterase domain
MRSTRRNEVKSLFSSRGNMVRAFAIFIALSCAGLLAEEVVAPVIVTPEEAARQVGKTVTVKGKVDGQKSSKAGNTYLNFGGNFPNHVFSCLLRAKNFTDSIPLFEGKVVEVTGMVTMYEGKPQIELTSLGQIRVVEEAVPVEAPPS